MATVEILARHTNRVVTVVVVEDVPLPLLEETAKNWRMWKERTRRRAVLASQSKPESIDWNWITKRSESAVSDARISGLFYDGRAQGLMMLARLPICSRSNPGRNAVYIEYLESAPWNISEYAAPAPPYGNIGTALLRYAVAVSKELGCDGRIALHALQSAEVFYRKKRFRDFGIDDDGFRYFELSGPDSGRL